MAAHNRPRETRRRYGDVGQKKKLRKERHDIIMYHAFTKHFSRTIVDRRKVCRTRIIL